MEAPVSKAIGRVKFGWRVGTESETGVVVGTEAEATTVEGEATTVAEESTVAVATEVVDGGGWRSPITVVVVNR